MLVNYYIFNNFNQICLLVINLITIYTECFEVKHYRHLDVYRYY